MKETKLPMADRLLPDTRLELLKDTLRYRFLDVVLLSILTGLFFLPLILWIVVATSLGLLDSSSIASVLLTYGIAILGFMIAGFGRRNLLRLQENGVGRRGHAWRRFFGRDRQKHGYVPGSFWLFGNFIFRHQGGIRMDVFG